MNELCILVSGLPASGKSTLGGIIANALQVPLFDKDVYLEQLYESLGVGDEMWRTRLSQQSNAIMQHEAMRAAVAVLVSHWQKPGSEANSGTPTQWICNSYRHIIELYCHCPVSVAVDRFRQRKRHPGHLDSGQSIDGLTTRFTRYSSAYPLQLGALIDVDTQQPLVVEDVLNQIQALIQARGGQKT